MSSLRREAMEVPALKRISLWHRLIPIVFVVTYLSLTVLLFAYGPWPWPVADGTKLYTFLTLAHLALLLGYLSAAFGNPRGYFGRWKPGTLIGASVALNLVLLLPTSLTRTGSLIPDVMAGLTNPGIAYADAQFLRGQANPLIEYVRMVVGPILALLVPLTIYYWRILKRLVKVLSIFAVAGFISIYVGMGTNKAIADLVLVSPWIILASNISGFQKFNWTKRVAGVVVATVGFVFFVSFFTAGQITRPGSGAVIGYFRATDTFSDPENFLVRNLPSDVRAGVVSLSSYLTHGYYALYLSLEKPFVFAYGVGNSTFLTRNSVALTGIKEIANLPYPVRIEEDGWDSLVLWSSIYPWIASDVSFPGTILVVFLIGRLLALAWLDTLSGANPFAISMFAQLTIMVYYFPANNQVMQSGEGLISFSVTLILWTVTRRKYTWGGRS